MEVGKENKVEQRSTHHSNLTQNGSHKPDHPCKTETTETKQGFRFEKKCFAKTEAGF